MFKLSPANLQIFIDTRLILTPSGIHHFKYELRSHWVTFLSVDPLGHIPICEPTGPQFDLLLRHCTVSTLAQTL
jgi:hypothetical protein